LPDLRDEILVKELEECLGAGKDRDGFRLVHYSIMTHHMSPARRQHGRKLLARWMDDCSSGRFFDGWRDGPRNPGTERPTVAAPRT
jgi:hypothetical protein